MRDESSPSDPGIGDGSRDQDAHTSEETLSFESVAPEIPGYKILGLLGRGGMGVVYLAIDESLGRKVAIKIISSSLPDEEHVVARFRREARSMAAVEHPNIVQVHSFGEADGRPYFVMQYIEGESLAKRILMSGRMTVSESLVVVGQVNDALEAAWRQQIVHRDLKPANILLDSDSRAHVADFGLARAVAADHGATVTQTGQLLGTPTYLAPEQARGEDVDFRVDIYSLGILFFEMLIGSPPFDATTPLAVVAKHLQDPLPPMSSEQHDIPFEIENTIRWMAAKKPASRPGSHQELRQKIERLSRDKRSISLPPENERTGERQHLEHSVSQAHVEFKTPGFERKRGPTETQRRQATVLKAEVLSHRQLAESLDSESMAVIASEMLDILTGDIERSGGTLVEVTPWKVTAVFGFPTAFENSPRKAVNAAIGIRNSLHRFRQERGLPKELNIRAGVDTGLLIAGGIDPNGAARYALMGDAVDAASLLRDGASGEQILVGKLTRRQTAEDFEFGVERELPQEKGRVAIGAFELLSSREKVFRAPISSRKIRSSELVGRSAELDRLELRILELLNGEGSIVNVVGPAGIGKSRLTAELQALNAEKKVAVLEGRAVAMGDTLGFHPIIDLLKNWAEIGERDSNTEAVHKLYSAISRVDPDGRDEVFPFVATLMRLQLAGSHAERVQGIEGDNLRQLINKNIRDLIIAASSVRPLVFILEDLHWADQTSIAFLESLYRVVVDHDILFINVFRPGYEQTSGRIARYLWQSFPSVLEEIVLDPLETQDCELLVANLFGTKNLPSRLKRMIIDKADGNPFFVEEVGRSFIEEGAVVLGDDRVTVSETIDAGKVPETIQDVLLARVDRLDNETRALIRIASVIGRRFYYRVLSTIAGRIGDLDDRLQFLEQLEMIRRLEAGDEVVFSFKHALTQEVVYGSILGAQRKRLHLEIAESIEDLFSERLREFFGMLAYHYCAAEELGKAEEFLIKAGTEALDSSASSEALIFYRHALDLYSKRRGADVDAKKIASLEKNIGVALYNHGQYVEAIDSFRRVLPHFGIRTPEGAVSLAGSFFVGLASFLLTAHFPALKFHRTPTPDESEGIRLYYLSLAALVHHDPKRFFLESFVLARRLSRFDLNRIENGVAMFASSANLLAWTGASFYMSRRVLALLNDRFDVPDKKTEISLGATRITHAFLAGEWDVPAYDEDLAESALGLGEVFLASNYVIFYGRLALERGEIEEAQRLADQLNEIGRQYDHTYPPALHVYLHSKILMKTRELDSSIDECTEGERLAREAALDTVVLGLGAIKARSFAFMGDLDEADRLLQEVEKAYKKTPLPRSYRGDILLTRCTIEVFRLGIAWRREDAKRFKEVRRDASRACRALMRNSKKVASHRVEATRLAGIYHLLCDQHQAAIRLWETGTFVGEELRARLDLARLYMEVGRWCVDPRAEIDQLKGKDGAHYLQQARALFEEMRIDWDLAEIADLSVDV